MKPILSGALFFALTAAAWAQELTTARMAALSEQSERTAEVIRAAAERQAVYQQGLEYIIPQLIVGGEWNTSLKLTNRGTASITAGRAIFVDNTGKPVSMTIQSNTGAPIAAAGLAFTLPAGGMIEVPFVSGTDTVFGHVLIDPATCPVGTGCALYAEATLRNRNATRPDFESVFPAEQPTDLQYMLFDHRTGYSTVLYLINLNTTATTVELEFRGTGNQLIKTVSVALVSAESQILSPHALAPETIGLQGTMIIRGANAATRALIVATALRINPSNSFTPMRAFVPRP